MTEETQSAVARLSIAAVGALAGLSVWGLFEVVPDLIDNERAVMVLIAFGLGFFGVLLALLGPVRLIPAALVSALWSACATLLLFWASFRHEDVSGFVDGSYGVAAYVYLLSIAVPFLAAGLIEQGGWRRYALLFDTAWNIVVRYAAAGLFVGVVWAVVLVSDALLGLVGIRVIHWLLDFAPVPYLLSGLALGLGLAIVHELSDYVSPFLLIQLLRVLMPALLVVLAVFILALPFRGLGGLFGQFSAAATLGAVAFGGITLITTAIHRDDELSVQGVGMLTTARVLSVLLPVPAWLALWAVWMRVDQYGLTPERVLALLATGIVAIYAAGFALAALTRADWRGHQRSVNRWMALLTLGVAALWLTPVLNSERLSTASQVARAEAGVPLEQLALWEMAHEWGRAGQLGLDKLDVLMTHPAGDTLQERIAQVRRETQRWVFDSDLHGAMIATLDGVVPVRPEGARVPSGALDALDPDTRMRIHKACARTLPDGHPGCVIVVGTFDPLVPYDQALLIFRRSAESFEQLALTLHDGFFVQDGSVRDLTKRSYARITDAALLAILEGRFTFVPVPRNALDVEGMQLFPQN
ncbi:DUF4153 domain-containing protein [Rhodobacteraceae bacterium KMM 6894]|nr:DUF4153 domain-containing protein [Rhodobacteraceae bacterium KMM 6894]